MNIPDLHELINELNMPSKDAKDFKEGLYIGTNKNNEKLFLFVDKSEIIIYVFMNNGEILSLEYDKTMELKKSENKGNWK